MLVKARPLLFCLFLVVCFSSFTSSFSWDMWSLFRTKTLGPVDPSKQKHVKRLSHQSASDPRQDVLADNVEWYNEAGTPLFYSAWRSNPNTAKSPEPMRRSDIFKGGARVACWPSTGGVWAKNVGLAEMDFLGLNRMDHTPRQFNQTAEDEFCGRLGAIGAQWWTLPPKFEERAHLGDDQFTCQTLEECFEPTISFPDIIAWSKIEQGACWLPVKTANERSQDKLDILHNTITMEERCDEVLGLGGLFCRCRAQCPELNDLIWPLDNGGDGGWGCVDVWYHAQQRALGTDRGYNAPVPDEWS
ncbi:hypothetical protein BDU57DRAFT_510659 [Ampelomyces quisqualis]|uniref:Uncharacterized protein n=1 Tax=Ampelomyces quisqualis TaxID=50730 RepID=A0A6A5R254_AMPQU|nr:hypothetical protein BDU57DRAFT_510659 [Ampelomyces quisqualis]